MGTYQITRLGTHFSICSVPHLCPLSVAITVLVLSHVVWGISKAGNIHPLPVWRDVQNLPGPLIAVPPNQRDWQKARTKADIVNLAGWGTPGLRRANERGHSSGNVRALSPAIEDLLRGLLVDGHCVFVVHDRAIAHVINGVVL